MSGSACGFTQRPNHGRTTTLPLVYYSSTEGIGFGDRLEKQPHPYGYRGASRLGVQAVGVEKVMIVMIVGVHVCDHNHPESQTPTIRMIDATILPHTIGTYTWSYVY